MLVLGALITLGGAIAFLLLGALAIFGGANATGAQVVPGFRPDSPGAAERALTLLGVWGPIALIALLCLLAAIKMFQVVAAAF
ncbi:MAG TPA: hypothetical protein PLO33_20025 [Kouleothrix sp.]|uniref:hypothetical protein n=1 Tax=Kouleothrix sp. TaxID=2779161 RepID=UPI002CAC9C23|nr:hypothetical protein [Kouleothrix sp.]HRC77984.1 hypothetical protein [Kouleothrix sp.]